MRGARIVLLWVLAGAAACSKESTTPPAPWTPGVVVATPEGASARGLLDRRGLIHAHSVYSHDACDGKPVVDGARDAVCFEDFRRGLCQTKHDFVMLTDHRESFAEVEFPEVLLHRPDRGDALIERDGRPAASWAACPDGRRSLILAGIENGTMPVGLERHVADRPDRDAIYGAKSPEAIEALKRAGAVVLVAHTEEWTVEDLRTLPLDGFEMFNLHANTFLAAGPVIELLYHLSEHDAELPHPDLLMLPLFSEDPRYVETWGKVLAGLPAGQRRVTTLGTDCHRNTFNAIVQDGERVDSYRRMMFWFSNHLLVKPDGAGKWDDRSLKEALGAGRLYGSFDLLGYPEGFDFHADFNAEQAATVEMGGDVQLSAHPLLRVRAPSVVGLDPASGSAVPSLTLRVLRATDAPGGWETAGEMVASEPGAMLEVRPTVPGAYRAEVRMVPRHLEPHLGTYRALASKDVPWIYANPIYVR